MNRRIWVLALVALVSSSCEEVVSDNDAVSPKIASFSASPASVLIGEETEVTWSFAYSNSPRPTPTCSIDGGVGEIGRSDTSNITLQEDTLFTLTCTNSAGSDTEDLLVSAIEDDVTPVISTFSASPASLVMNTATDVTWTWSYSNSPVPTPSCSINEGVGGVGSGDSTSVSIEEDTTYILTCTNAAGSDTAQKTITVVASAVAPDIASFSATPDVISTGTPSAITWNWTYSNNPTPTPTCTIDHEVGPVENGTVTSIAIGAATTYRLTCTNSAGSDSADTLIEPMADCPDLDLDSVPDCQDTCIDRDGDTYGHPGDAGNTCTEADCDDQDPERGLLCSDYLRADSDAIAIRLGTATVTLPTTQLVDDFDITWRMTNALRMLGYLPYGIMTGETLGGDEIRAIDQELYAFEKIMQTQADRLPDYAEIAAPDFLENIPQRFVAYLLATLFDLTNKGTYNFQSFTNQCVLANFIPQMCGALVDMGTTTGVWCGDAIANDPTLLRSTQIIQTPELFGFNNVRRPIGPLEYPPSHWIPDTFQYVATLLHEFAHDLDRAERNFYMDAVYDRTVVCSSHSMDFYATGTPFVFSGAAGTQDIADFVSGYAAGLVNQNQDYRRAEEAAETLTAYILAPEYFRARLQASATLELKYEWIRDRIMGGVEFENPHMILQGPMVDPDLVILLADLYELERFVIHDIRVKE